MRSAEQTVAVRATSVPSRSDADDVVPFVAEADASPRQQQSAGAAPKKSAEWLAAEAALDVGASSVALSGAAASVTFVATTLRGAR